MCRPQRPEGEETAEKAPQKEKAQDRSTHVAPAS